MATLAIKGHRTRGKEVIEILEMIGGRKERNLGGAELCSWYYINENGVIDYKHYSLFYDTMVFTLEEFLEKYPYKVGDKVSSKYLKNYKIEEMKWTDITHRVVYKLQGMGWYSVDELKPYKEETMKENLEQITLDIPDGYEFFGINDDNKVVLTKKYIQYPKTYEECCKVLGICPNGDIVYAGNWTYGGEYLEKHLERIRNFQKILICCDAYWKIAGEQMGWSEPWKPDWKSLDEKYNIYNYRGVISHDCFTVIDRCVLVFPTAEMRDAFYENFKSLIEECKGLL
jgi:hypothetical protein